MNILRKSSAGVQVVPLESELLAKRMIFLSGEISHQSAQEAIKQILYLNMESTTEPITILINSPGGDINAGLLIVDAIRGSRVKIRTICTGHAYSMAAVILAAGTGGRYILENSDAMIHEPAIGDFAQADTKAISSIFQNLVSVKKKIANTLAGYTLHSMDTVYNTMTDEKFFSAKEAVEWGLCDKIIDFSEILEE